MRALIVFAFLIPSLTQAVVIDEFNCVIHVYGVKNVPATVISKQSVVREIVSQKSDQTITFGKVEMSANIEFGTDETMYVGFKHKYYHITEYTTTHTPIRAQQTICNEMNFNNLGAYEVCDLAYAWPVPINNYPEYLNSPERNPEMSLTKGKYKAVVGCQLLKTKYYPEAEKISASPGPLQ